MATEKILQTRILNKVDTLENWGKSTLKIKQGEICFATVAASAGTGLTEPVVMVKIGTAEEKTFAELPWSFYAKASDVLTACKSEDGLKAFVNGVIADAGIASNDAMETLAGRVTTTENDIKTLKGDESTAGSVAKAIKDAIDALDLANTYVAKEEGKGLSANDLTDDLMSNYDTAYTHSQVAHAPADAQANVIESIKVNGTEQTVADKAVDITVPTKASDVGAYTTGETDAAVQDAKDYAKGLVDAIPAQTDYTVSVEEDTTDSTIAKRYIFKQLGEEIGRIDLAKELVVTAGSVGEVEEAGKPYAGAVVGDKYIELVIANQDAPIYIPAKDLVDIYTAKDGATEVQVAISNTNEISATLVNGGVAKVKLAEDVQTSLGKADTAIQEADIAGLRTASHTHNFTDADVEDAIAKEHEHANKTVLDGITAEKVGAWDDAEGNAKAYADGLAGNYATAAQGAKADTAIQSVTSVACNGIKATTDGTSVTIDWDSAVTLVFDCGNSGVTA